ncbi:hypothetical protein [Spiroplasma kunkelii]|nr:hypothetical protein [Spiroplasma kunkelii]
MNKIKIQIKEKVKINHPHSWYTLRKNNNIKYRVASYLNDAMFDELKLQ